MARRSLTDKGVAALKPRAARYAFPDPGLPGHYVRVTSTGAKSFAVVTRDPAGKQIWTTLGPTNLLAIEEAREKAREAIMRIRGGLPAFEPPPTAPDSFKDVAENWMRRHVEANGLRSGKELARLLKVYIHPRWGDRPFLSIRRSDVARLLDEVQDANGARQADYVLALVRSIFNWFQARSDHFVSPISRGMRRQSPTAQARARILDDDEIRALWHAPDAARSLGGIVKLCLLTAQRRTKVATMRWQDVSIDGEWTIPADDREKGNAGSLLLPDAALSIINAQPRVGSNEFVFAGRGEGPFNGWSKSKARLDERLAVQCKAWVIHDLRRTARSLMSRAGVRPDIAERVLGHTIAGVEGVYDRHSYHEEKRDALARLAALIETITSPPSANVRRLRDYRQ